MTNETTHRLRLKTVAF